MQLSIRIENLDKAQEFLKSRPIMIKKELNRAVKKTALLIQAESKRRSPVDTGRLKTSIKVKTIGTKLQGEVATNVRYGIYVHEGTRKMSGRPFMENAVKHSTSKIKKFFEDAIKRVLKT